MTLVALNRSAAWQESTFATEDAVELTYWLPFTLSTQTRTALSMREKLYELLDAVSDQLVPLVDRVLEVDATASEVVEDVHPLVTPLTGDDNIRYVRIPRDLLRQLSVPAATPSPAPLHERNVIAERLEEARDVLGVTSDEIADAVIVSRSSLFAWANSTTNPRPSSRRQLDRLFSVTGVAVQMLGRAGARDWFASGSPSRGERLLSGDFDAIAGELEQLISRPTRAQRPARIERDEEPTRLDESR